MSNHGGARQGAGRPKTGRIATSCNVSMPEALWKWVESCGGRSKVIQKCVRLTMGRDMVTEYQRVTGIVQCGKCQGCFTNLNMTQPCPDCGGEMVYGCTADVFRDSFANSQVLDILLQEDAELVMNTMDALGFEFDPDASGQDRLRVK